MTGDQAKILLDEAKKYRVLRPWEAKFYTDISNIGIWSLSKEQTFKVQEIYADATGGGRVQRKVRI
ncbi:MAG: hypothetical protein WC551_10360 [Patescibacteria group bacterium]